MGYKHVFFDLDQTLWDFDRCSAETIQELYQSNKLSKQLSGRCDDLIETFTLVNDKLWAAFSAGKITKEELRHRRFREIFGKYGTLPEELIDQFATDYLKICPQKKHLVPGALDVLNYLSKKYQLHIITNGFEEVQYIKLTGSGIIGFFKEVITSEQAGFRKPEKEIFTYALKKVNCSPGSCIMIGDNLEADILGASNSLIDHVFYNPKRIGYFLSVTYEITHLSELKGIL